jgi:tetratricopeptide (TPR) repeat protein
MWPAAFIAALFAWHPLHVESVAWVAERKDVLSAFFGLLTLLAYEKYARENSRRAYGFALLFFALGLMAKPMLVTLPCVLLLLDWWPLNRLQVSNFKLQVLTEKIPFFLLTVISCWLTYAAQASKFHGDAAVVPLAHMSLDLRFGNVPLAFMAYLEKFFWPLNLAIYYPVPKLFLIPQVAVDALILLLITFVAWRWRANRPYFLAGWLWFLGMLVPVIGIVRVGGAAYADRYTYLPLIGIFIIIVFAAEEMASRRARAQKMFPLAAAVILAGCVFLTERQIGFWKNGETIFRHDLEVAGDNDIALGDLGVALDAQGRYAEAVEIYRRALVLNPDRYQLHNNLGNALSLLGRPDESLEEYHRAIRLRPDRAFLHSSTGMQLATLGRLDEALQEFSTAQKLDPADFNSHFEAGKVLFKLGRDPEGIAEFRAAVRLDPNNYQALATVAHYLAANANAAARDPQNAVMLSLQANEISGHAQPMVFDILGMALAASGDFTNAATCAQNALQLAAAAQMKNTEPIRQRLELYHKNQPWRESFLATNGPAKN